MLKKFRYSPAATCIPVCGLMLASLNFHVSVGDMIVVLDSLWIFWRIVLKPAFTEKSSVKA